jgi:hypothetical protein
MKLGDLIRHYDADCGAGIIVEMPPRIAEEGRNPPDVVVLWNDGEIEYCDPLILELVE